MDSITVSKKNLKILLRGYYGWGNFGDDLLMLISFRLLRTWFPGAQINISSASPRPEYIYRMLGENTSIDPFGQGGDYDLIFRGGGGVFFDFKNGCLIHLLRNFFIKIVGLRKFSSIFNSLKKTLGRPFVHANYRCGIGVGVGTYTLNSEKFIHSATELSKQDLILVRDEESRKNALFIDPLLYVKVYTDLAFHRKMWMISTCNIEKYDQACIGFVLRDWKYNNSQYLVEFERVIRALQGSGILCKIIILDKHGDPQTASRFSFVDQVVWDVEQMTFKDFIQEFYRVSLIVSSRAHGAIVGACLGIPVFCYPIEPKLDRVREMLGDGAKRYIPAEDPEGEILKAALMNLKCSEILSSVAKNETLMEEGIDFLRTSLKKKFEEQYCKMPTFNHQS